MNANQVEETGYVQHRSLSRVATAAVGALVLSTLSVAAAVGPAQSAGSPAAAYAMIDNGTRTHG
ncbi:hypothetical protein [Sphingosinicella sp. CPCC 101087]|uniref:hypothetical protein n=1 Tax=Sphingosinicella sp. CPCC 101087 TaxID=2497754 RepID=UPI00101BD5FD|nr:hypothetical protein [Sphingosinicella sp. CPCC 101087]